MEFPEILHEELYAAVFSMGRKKAPGEDGIPIYAAAYEAQAVAIYVAQNHLTRKRCQVIIHLSSCSLIP